MPAHNAQVGFVLQKGPVENDVAVDSSDGSPQNHDSLSGGDAHCGCSFADFNSSCESTRRSQDLPGPRYFQYDAYNGQ